MNPQEGSLSSRIGNVLLPTPGWPDYVMDLVADCVNVAGTIDEAWHWRELEEAMLIENEFRTGVLPC